MDTVDSSQGDDCLEAIAISRYADLNSTSVYADDRVLP